MLIISKYNSIFQGTLEDLKRLNTQQNVILIETDYNARARLLLEGSYNVFENVDRFYRSAIVIKNKIDDHLWNRPEEIVDRLKGIMCQF